MKRLITLSFLLSFIAGCGTQLQAVKNCSIQTCEAGNSPLSEGPSGSNFTWNDIHMDSKIVGGVHNGQETISFDQETKMVKVRIPVSGGAFLGESANLGAIPGVTSSDIRIIVEANGSTVILIQMNLIDLLAGMNSSNQSTTLPNGSNLPNFPAGDVAYNDMEINAAASVTGRIYMGSGAFGIYVETPFNPFIQISFPSKNTNGDVLGYLTQVPAQSSFAGGFFMSLVLPENMKQSIQSLL